MKLYNFFLALLLIPGILHAYFNIEQTLADNDQLNIKLTLNLPSKKVLYQDSLSISVDNPSISLSAIQSHPEATYRYDETSKQKKLVYTSNVEFNLQAIKKISSIDKAHLHIMYQTNTDSAPKHEIFPLSFEKQNISTAMLTEINQSPVLNNKSDTRTKIAKSKQSLIKILWNSSQYISKLLEHSRSLPIQLFLVFLLGILLSLTPCIYPMIPITIGVLHSQQKKSFLKNLARASSYTMGIALTFAALGYCASCIQFTAGTLLANPFFIIPLVGLLGYLAFSMLGFYEMYIPRFLQQKQRGADGSLFSAFVFGAASGTIASPCVSPGLALVLSMAALSGSALIGFFLLFIFGIGLSMPLLIVGTFSSSLNLLPQSGAWMLEIKKFFGLLLLAVCFYYLNNIFPFYVVLLLIAATLFLIGIYYVYVSFNLQSFFWKRTNIIIGILFIIISIVIIPHAYLMKFATDELVEKIWYHNYEDARKQAINEQKKIFIDFWAQYCSICKAINKAVLSNTQVISTLQNFIPVMIDGTNETDEQFKALKEKFNITGFPTYLIIDPETEQILKKWGGELYHMPQEQFIEELKK